MLVENLSYTETFEQFFFISKIVMTHPNQKKIPALAMKERKTKIMKLIENWRHRWQQCYHQNMPMLMFANCSQIFVPTKCYAFLDYLDLENPQVYHKFGEVCERNDESESSHVKIEFVPQLKNYLHNKKNILIFVFFFILAKRWI